MSGANYCKALEKGQKTKDKLDETTLQLQHSREANAKTKADLTKTENNLQNATNTLGEIAVEEGKKKTHFYCSNNNALHLTMNFDRDVVTPGILQVFLGSDMGKTMIRNNATHVSFYSADPQ